MKMIALLIAAACAAACMAHGTECPERPCTREMNPQCATFVGKFDNPCLLQAARCELGKQGLYLQTSTPGECDCVRPCTADNAPVCGSNGKTYSNACGLDTAICQGEKIGQVSNSACP